MWEGEGLSLINAAISTSLQWVSGYFILSTQYWDYFQLSFPNCLIDIAKAIRRLNIKKYMWFYQIT